MTFDRERFAEVQSRLATIWPILTPRETYEPRTVIVVSSVSLDVPTHLHPLIPAYEERYLFYVLTLARAPLANAVYVTSQPVLPRLLDYYLNLLPDEGADVSKRLHAISVGDTTPRPLTAKIIERPRLVERIRCLVQDPDRAVILPFVTTEHEAALAVSLGVPVYGPHPDLSPLGTKSGSREVFRAAGVDVAFGAERVHAVDDVVDVLLDVVRARAPAQAIVKLDVSYSGLGNAEVDLRGATTRDELEARVRGLRPEDEELTPEQFLDQLAEQGGVVEERVTGDEVRSPSVQLRASPLGGIEVLSTHDQVLGGPTGQTYFGCRFPASPAYAAAISTQALRIAEELAARGVIGRFGIDFVAARRGDTWHTYALEINLRNGGTTHPAVTLLGLTQGRFDATSSTFEAGGRPKHYVATDHLEHDEYRVLTPDDVLDVIDEHALGWDPSTMTGIVFHFLSAVAVAGRIGLTAIADDPAGAERLYRRAEQVLLDAATS